MKVLTRLVGCELLVECCHTLASEEVDPCSIGGPQRGRGIGKPSRVGSMPTRHPARRRRYKSPDSARVLGNHWLAFFAAERLPEFGHVYHRADRAIVSGRMRIDGGEHTRVAVGEVLATALSVGNKEALLGREAADLRRGWFILQLVLVGAIG